MSDELEQKYPILYRRYKRKVTDHPEETIRHHGDCCIYASFMPICTCGLHHSLQVITNGDIHQLYPKYYEEMEGVNMVDTLMGLHTAKKLWQSCEECDGRGGLGQIMCPVCMGKGVVLFKIPEPLTDEQIAEISKKLYREFNRGFESIVKKNDDLDKIPEN
jgi:hypothetical protein